MSPDALRRLQRRARVAGELVTAEHGGTVTLLSSADLDALRLAAGERQPIRQPPTAKRANRQPPTDPPSANRQPPTAEPDALRPDADGWREALAQANARTQQAEAQADTLRAERDVARVEAQTAVRRAEEAERGQSAANERVASLRAAWWRWYALANGPWWRRLRGLPKPPAEVDEPPLLAAPRG